MKVPLDELCVRTRRVRHDGVEGAIERAVSSHVDQPNAGEVGARENGMHGTVGTRDAWHVDHNVRLWPSTGA